MAQSTLAGIFTAVASIITALGLLVTSIGVLVPILRRQKVAEKKLDSIHILVNSTLTAAKDAQRAGAERELVLLEEMSRLHTEAGRAQTESEKVAIQEARERVSSLRAEIADREEQTDAANAVMKRDR